MTFRGKVDTKLFGQSVIFQISHVLSIRSRVDDNLMTICCVCSENVSSAPNKKRCLLRSHMDRDKCTRTSDRALPALIVFQTRVQKTIIESWVRKVDRKKSVATPFSVRTFVSASLLRELNKATYNKL